MALQLANIHTPQKYCAHAYLSQEDKGIPQDISHPHQGQSQPHSRRWEFLLASHKERFFPSVFLLAGLAQTATILNIIQFCTNSLLSPHQTDPVTPLTAAAPGR